MDRSAIPSLDRENGAQDNGTKQYGGSRDKTGSGQNSGSQNNSSGQNKSSGQNIPSTLEEPRHPVSADARSTARTRSTPALSLPIETEQPEAASWIRSARLRPEVLARNLAHGAMLELRLTPKPGLVDLRSSGSHPDLTVEMMTRSASLLPAYFRELMEADRHGRGMAASVEAGRRAEGRMLAAVGSNAHRGLIFLAGLLLLSACRADDAGGAATRERELHRNARRGDSPGGPSRNNSSRDNSSRDNNIRSNSNPSGDHRDHDLIGDVRLHCSVLAEEFFHKGDPKAALPNAPANEETHGARVRREHSLGGIRAEALAGLPAVFEVGLPAFAASLKQRDDFVRASHYCLARLMQTVEDTTAVHRCGAAGLTRVRHDGGLLQRVLEEDGDHLSLIERLDSEYSEMGLTMGGVADCLSLTYAVYLTAARVTEAEVGDLQVLFLQRRHRHAAWK